MDECTAYDELHAIRNAKFDEYIKNYKQFLVQATEKHISTEEYISYIVSKKFEEAKKKLKEINF